MLTYFNSMNFAEYMEVKHLLSRGKSFTVSGLTNTAKTILLGQVNNQKNKKILFITDSEQSAIKYKNDLKKLLNIESEVFPYQDGSIYEGNLDNLYKYSEQVNIINNLDSIKILIAPVKSLLEKFAPKDFYAENKLEVKINDDIEVSKFAKKLVNLGYKKATMVVDSGEFSIRGDIIDVFSLDKNPVRIELWGDSVVDIRSFDNKTQRSIEKLSQINILPLYKFVLSDENKKEFIKELNKNTEKNLSKSDKDIQDLIKEKLEEITQNIEEGYFEGIDYYQTYFNKNLKSFIELLSEDYLIIFDEYSQVKTKYQFIDENFQKQYNEGILPAVNLPLNNFAHCNFMEFNKVISERNKIYFDNFIDEEAAYLVEYDTNLVMNFSSKIDEIVSFIDDNLKKGYKIIISTDYKSRIEEILREFEIAYSFDIEDKNTVFITGAISMPGTLISSYKTIILTDKELFNKRSKDITAQKKSYYKENPDFIESVNDIKPDDYVVHMVHGIGIFKGLTKQEIDGEEKDYLTIEYAAKDKLHIPAEQINFLCRYRGSGSIKPVLSRMGGNDWNNTKSRAKKAVEDVAQELLNLYARRQVLEGIEFEPDTVWQYEMEEAFEYTETPDQMKAINDVKLDMEDKKPMDRLICGDVGFGKTEVAIRAIFKAVMSSKQVAIVVPTTILAMQHYETIKERFKPFPIKIELLSRFRSQKEQKETLKHLITGECDVVVGTHRLLQKDIEFKDLGILVLDEEHKFGVKHKEKLKMLKKNIDVLSMSATPIPRTLYMSLSGIKDMSVINTPPKNRLPIKTFVGEFKDSIVKNAINYELQRDGQVFYLYNRVETIYEFGSYLKDLLPNASIAVAHGQMDEKQLEKIMLDFIEKKYDVLICTTIIESGLDVQNANTIIIHNADRFGLAQLYQLRGRVGRSDRQAYCYCLYKNTNKLSDEAVKRLKSIKEFTTLGSGYQIALRDIEIRGVGNILGTRQHGQMVNVGFDTYCALLEEAINELREIDIKPQKPTIVDINVTAYIPDEWVGSKEQKMIEYKRLADVKSISELDLITVEWKDRFSKMSEPVENLIKLIHIRLLASQVNVTLIRETDTNIRVYTPFKQAEWNIIKQQLPTNITKYIKFTQAPKSCLDGESILLIDNSVLNFEELFNMLTNLFYYILKITCEYKEK